MNEPGKVPSTRKQDSKTLLSAMKMTTTIGAVSLTLAGWALLSRAEALTVAQAAQINSAGFAAAAPGLSTPASVAAGSGPNPTGVVRTAASVGRAPTATTLPRVTATPRALSQATVRPTALPRATVTPTPLPRATVVPTTLPKVPATPDVPAPSPTPLFKLDVVQWVQTQAGQKVAVVRDNQGTLWYVMGTDVPRIENGLQPEYQPQPVNGGGRTRRS